MSEAVMLRFLNRLYAELFGYFWLGCPLCGEFFGGHEWTNHDSLDGKGICNACARKRVLACGCPPTAKRLTFGREWHLPECKHGLGGTWQ